MSEQKPYTHEELMNYKGAHHVNRREVFCSKMPMPRMEREARRVMAEIERLKKMNPVKRWFLYELDPRSLASVIIWLLVAFAVITVFSHR